jgi:acetyl-CoA synthetase
VERALLPHRSGAEPAVIGKPDAVEGDIIKDFVILRAGQKPSDRLKQNLKYHVRMILGPIAQPEDIDFVDNLPKTRRGKILRRVLKAKELGMDPGDISILEE